MPDIQFMCPECKEYLSVDVKGAGRVVKCPKCSKQIKIPDTSPNEDINSAEVDKFETTLKNRTTEELIAIWVTDDRTQWRDEAFVAIKKILIARGVPFNASG